MQSGLGETLIADCIMQLGFGGVSLPKGTWGYAPNPYSLPNWVWEMGDEAR